MQYKLLTQQISLLVIPLLFSLGCGCVSEYHSNGLLLSHDQAKKQALDLVQPRLSFALEYQDYAVQLFNQKWEPLDKESVRLYDQARQVYLFVKAYEWTSELKYLQAAEKSADFMLEAMFDENAVIWRSLVSKTDLEPLVGNNPYDTAFAIFAMSQLATVSENKRYLDSAYKTWLLGDTSLGLEMSRALSKPDSAFETATLVWYQNPFMHLFEALLVLYSVSNDQYVWNDIEVMASLVKERLVQPSGALPEYFLIGASISAQPEEEGGHVILGHQIEWAFLLRKAVSLGLDYSYLSTAEKLESYALDTGWNSEEGFLHARSNYDGSKVGGIDWWSQAELMRLSAWNVQHGSAVKENQKRFAANYAYSLNELIDQRNLGWNDFLLPQARERNKVIGYHAVAMYDTVMAIYSTAGQLNTK